MAETAFGVAYDGPALVDGRMAVRDLAPALLALGDLFADAGLEAYPDRGPVTLNIQAAPERGSFVIHLIVEAKGVWDQVTSFFDSEAITALNNLEATVFGPVGIFALIKWLRGRKVKSQERVREGYIRLTLEDGDTIEVPTTVVELTRNQAVRQKAREVIAPLETEGVDSVEFRPSSQPAIRVEAADLPAFKAAEPEEEPLGTQETVMVLVLTTPKSGKLRAVPLAPDVASALAQLGRRKYWVGDDDLVFAGDAGGHLDGSALRRRCKEALGRAGLRPLRFHDLHTFGTRMIAKADIRRVQEWMGHAAIQTTIRYLHYAPRSEDAQLVAEAFRVQGLDDVPRRP
jgi:Phage integrase family